MAIQLQGLLFIAFGLGSIVMGVTGVGYLRDASPIRIPQFLIIVFLIVSMVMSGLLTLDRGWSAVHGNKWASQVHLF